MVEYWVACLVEMKEPYSVVRLVATMAVVSVLQSVDEMVVYLAGMMDMMWEMIMVVWMVGLLARRRAGSMAALLEILMALK